MSIVRGYITLHPLFNPCLVAGSYCVWVEVRGGSLWSARNIGKSPSTGAWEDWLTSGQVIWQCSCGNFQTSIHLLVSILFVRRSFYSGRVQSCLISWRGWSVPCFFQGCRFESGLIIATSVSSANLRAFRYSILVLRPPTPQ